MTLAIAAGVVEQSLDFQQSLLFGLNMCKEQIIDFRELQTVVLV